MRRGGRLARARFAPKATVSNRSATCRDGPQPDISACVMANTWFILAPLLAIHLRVLAAVRDSARLAKLGACASVRATRFNWVHLKMHRTLLCGMAAAVAVAGAVVMLPGGTFADKSQPLDQRKVIYAP